MEENTERKLSRNLTPLGAWAFALGTSIGWGSLVVTSSTYLAQAGPAGSVLGMLAGTGIMLLISRNYAYMMNAYPEAGGAYAYMRQTYGYDYGFLTAWFLLLTYLAILWANATAVPLFARYFLGELFEVGRLYSLFGYDVYIGEILITVAVLLLVAWLCARFRDPVAGIMTGMVLFFSAAILCCFAVSALRGGVGYHPAWVPERSAFSQTVHIAVISPWAFIGFESISHGAEEFRFRREKVFPMLVAAVLATSLLYILVTLLSVSAYPPGYSSWLDYIRDLGNLKGIEALPAFYAARHYLGSAGVTALMLALLCLVLTSLVGNISALSRLLFSLGRDHVLPPAYGELNRYGAPGRAVLLIAGISALVPFLGRTTIGWIVDVTTIGATLIYGFVSAAAAREARIHDNILEKWTGRAGVALMTAFAGYILLPNLISSGSMAKETYFLFVAWGILGFVFFRRILHRDRARRFGKSVVVWVALLSIMLLIGIIWMRQSMIDSTNTAMQNIQEYLMRDGSKEALREETLFIREQMAKLDRTNRTTILTVAGLFVFSLTVMLSNYTYMSKRTKESENIANTDRMTGVKSKHAFLSAETEIDSDIANGVVRPFAIVVCDVNGLKHINDTLGHKAGDDYIRAASAMICKLFQHSPVFRTGGDEFVVILRGEDFERRREIMRQLQTQSVENIGAGRVVVSGGMADYIPGDDLNVHAVTNRADEAMYRNKKELKALGAKSRD